MKHQLFLSDFLLLRDSMNEELLDKCVAAYGRMKMRMSLGEHSWKDKFEVQNLLQDLIKSIDNPHIGFDSDDHEIESVYAVVKIMWDIISNGTGYIIKRVPTPNPPKKTPNPENE